MKVKVAPEFVDESNAHFKTLQFNLGHMGIMTSSILAYEV
jgi:hypothetical protein